MIPHWQAYADLILHALEASGLLERTTVVLIGSAARNVSTWRSDVDILVLAANKRCLELRPTGELHLQQESRRRFLKRLREGDDYPMWALRFGVALHDPDRWWATQVAKENKHPHWPNWTTKISHASKRIKMAKALLDTEDIDAATEEFLYAASHIARATLLKRKIFPLSRPELPTQLTPYDPELAQVLQELIEGNLDSMSSARVDCILQNRLQALTNQAIATTV